MCIRDRSEGDATPADMVITVDINRVHELSETGLLASLSSTKIKNQVPTHLRDKSDKWTALSLRARIAAVSVQRVKKSEVSSLADLTKSDLKGRVCKRVGSHVYNRALLASIIANEGEVVGVWKILFNNDSRFFTAVANRDTSVIVIPEAHLKLLIDQADPFLLHCFRKWLDVSRSHIIEKLSLIHI